LAISRYPVNHEPINKDQDMTTIQALLNNEISIDALDDCALREVYTKAVESYRAFQPVFTDAFFDGVLAPAFARRFPDAPELEQPEAEKEDTFGAVAVAHEIPMLSTDKAYSNEDIERFIRRLTDAGNSMGLDPADNRLRVTPKLDGLAGTINSKGQLLTRGQNGYGFDISRVFERGLRGNSHRVGVGEIVIGQAMFEQLKTQDASLKHPRNLVGGIISADTLSLSAKVALDAGEVCFLRYDELPAWEGTLDAFLINSDKILEAVRAYDYCLTDGVVLEAIHPSVRKYLGSTSHHHRWQLAVKEHGETALTRVTNIEYQVGRTGRITPVIHYEPVHLSGAELSKVTGHSPARLRAKGIGVGAQIRIIRSGEVIPHIIEVKETSGSLPDSTVCPACGTALVEEKGQNDNQLRCPNHAGCPAQAGAGIQHFFRLLKIKGFGPATANALVEQGVAHWLDVFTLIDEDFQAAGLGEKQIQNLTESLEQFLQSEVDDWLLLAALGIRRLGRGDSRKLLAAHSFDQVFALNADQIAQIKGFGPGSAPAIAAGLAANHEAVDFLRRWGLRLKTTVQTPSNAADGVLQGKRIVFTGTMNAPRAEVEAAARALGAQVQNTVSGKTDWLVVGERVGVSKMNKAKALGVKILPEAAYLELI
jgi:DNA ligase (NAD+)